MKSFWGAKKLETFNGTLHRLSTMEWVTTTTIVSGLFESVAGFNFR